MCMQKREQGRDFVCDLEQLSWDYVRGVEG